VKTNPSRSRGLSVGLVGLALVGSAALSSTPAHATTPGHPAASSGAASSGGADGECLVPASRATKWRKGADTSEVSAKVKAEVSAVVASAARTSSARTSAAGALAGGATSPARAAAAGQIFVPVYIHVIHGRHKGERRIGKHAARRMFRTLKAGYSGAQDPAAGATGVTFKLRKIRINRNERWFHAAPYSRADRQMKSRLHRGKARVLNIYVNRPRSRGQLLLGYSMFPWQRASRPKLDGVTISDISLPGGRARGYNLGDTVIHETGHWLGLLHTFEGGCVGGEGGDGVADTPAEAVPSFRCDERDTCPIAEYPNPADPTGPMISAPDPIHNFMDYSYDFCMSSFTPGQNARMLALFMHYRTGR
jgi:hypothetical protein